MYQIVSKFDLGLLNVTTVIDISMEIRMAKFWKAMNESCVARAEFFFYRCLLWIVHLYFFFLPIQDSHDFELPVLPAN